MSTTNATAASLVDTAVEAGRVLTVRCPNGDTVTASRAEVLRWGRSRFALPSGLSVALFGSIGEVVVRQCGRGNAVKATQEN